jgi:hypothetical protein
MYWKPRDSNFWVVLIIAIKKYFFRFRSFIIKDDPEITEDNSLGNTTLQEEYLSPYFA